MDMVAYLSVNRPANKIVIYAGERFTGRSIELINSISNLNTQGFNDTISSLKVIGPPWVAYYDVNYSGKMRVFEEGEYPTLQDKGQFSSLRMITENLTNPVIHLFEDTNYEGRIVVLKDEKNLHYVDFGDAASSHQVKSGVWVLYEHGDRKGNQLVCFPGQNVPNYCEIGFNDVISHARPLKPK